MRMRSASTAAPAVLLLMASMIPALGQQDSDDAAVRAVVARYVEAREKQDPQATQALFTADADQLVSSGEWRRGLDNVVKGTMASSKSTGGTRTITVETVRFISKEVAIVDGRYELAGLSGGATRKMWTTLLIAKAGGEWKIAAIRNMLPAPPTPTK